MRSPNLVLGAFDRVDYSATPVELLEGDILVVYSDGLTEAENLKGDMFGERRLIDLIQAQANKGAGALQKIILDDVEAFTESHAQTDDITLLLVQRVG